MDTAYYDCRRTVKRFACFLAGRYRGQDEAFHDLGLEEISPQGARVLAFQPLAINETLSMDITTRDMSLMPLSGKVCWCKKALHGWRAGIAFEKHLQFDIKSIT